jgi:hypothetical protein
MANESQVLKATADAIGGRLATSNVALANPAGVNFFTSSGVVLYGDVRVYVLAGAPVDYTDGSPPATGEGEAGIGSLAVRVDTGKWYTNKGTKAQPVWGIITSA